MKIIEAEVKENEKLTKKESIKEKESKEEKEEEMEGPDVNRT